MKSEFCSHKRIVSKQCRHATKDDPQEVRSESRKKLIASRFHFECDVLSIQREVTARERERLGRLRFFV